MAIPSGMLISIGNVAKSAMLLNATLPEVRGTVFAIGTVMDYIGKGLGGFAIALVDDIGRYGAFNVAIGFSTICGIMFFSTIFTIERDVREQADRAKVLMKRAQGRRLSVSNSPHKDRANVHFIRQPKRW